MLMPRPMWLYATKTPCVRESRSSIHSVWVRMASSKPACVSENTALAARNCAKNTAHNIELKERIRSKTVHNFGTCNKNAAAQWRLQMNLAAKWGQMRPVVEPDSRIFLCVRALQIRLILLIDWCCFYYFVRNSLVALLEALCALMHHTIVTQKWPQ